MVTIGGSADHPFYGAGVWAVATIKLADPEFRATSERTFQLLAQVAGRRPDLVLRFGRGPTLPRSMRRPLDAVLI